MSPINSYVQKKNIVLSCYILLETQENHTKNEFKEVLFLLNLVKNSRWIELFGKPSSSHGKH
jgi:hypothetical protein